MNPHDDGQLVPDLIRDIAADVLEQIGDDADARFEFFKRFIDLAIQFTSAAAPSH